MKASLIRSVLLCSVASMSADHSTHPSQCFPLHRRTVLPVVVMSRCSMKVQMSCDGLTTLLRSAGLTDGGRGVHRSSTPGGSSEMVNGEEGHGQGDDWMIVHRVV